MLYTSYLANKLVDWLVRGQAYTPATTTLSIGLLTSTKGARTSSTAYSLNDTISLIANDGITHLYKCTTAGTSAAAQSTLYPGIKNEVITDGAAVFAEQYAAMKNATVAEAAYTGYTRTTVAASLANYSGTQGAGTTTASTGSGIPSTSNNIAITIGGSNTGTVSYVWATAWFDAATAGNMLMIEPLATAAIIQTGDAGPSFAPAALSFSIDE